MCRVLTIDIGAGTMDVLYYNLKDGTHYKSVVRSPVATIAEKVLASKGKLLIRGSEMGGGALSQVLKEYTRKTEVVVSESAARTVHHNLDRVRSLGVKVVENYEADKLAETGEYCTLTFGDVEVERIIKIVEGFGVPFSVDIVGVCAQDHGVAPAGVSHLDYRHNIFEQLLNANPYPHVLLYRDDEVPETMNRLRCIAKTGSMLNANEVYVMDSGMAAILGASMDPRARDKSRLLVMDIATSHTVGAALEDGELNGFFEYHTHDITLERLEILLKKLADGELKHQQILAEGGHGAYIRKAFGFQKTELIIATGPKRKLMEPSTMPILRGAPLGDNMMTGTVGLLEAIRRRKQLPPISYS
jgi:uncharacterized protein (DUF1786 family)